MNPNSPEQPQSSPSTEPISTEWDSSATFIEKTPEEHLPPEALRDIGKKALQETTSPELEEDNANEEQNTESAPEGWLTIKKLVEELGLNYSTIKRAINQDPPIEGKEYKAKNGILAIRYPLSKVAKRVEHLTSAEYPPEGEGWKNQAKIAKQLADQFKGKVSEKKVISTIKKLKNEGRIKGRTFKVGKGQPNTFYSLDEQFTIFEEIQEFVSSNYPPEDEDWKNQAEIAQQLANQSDGLGKDKVKRTIAKLTEAGRIKGRIFKGGNNSRPIIFYSSDEQAIIFKEIEKFISFDYPPEDEDWKNQNNIANQLAGRVSEKKIAIIIKKLAEAGQITGQIFKGGHNGQLITFYSPDEQAKIFEALEEFISLDYPPEDEDWKNRESIAQQLANQFEGLSKNKVISTIKKLKNEGRIKGRTFKVGKGQPNTFYSPDEQAKIFEALEEFISLDYPPEDEDWKNQENIANQLAYQFEGLSKDKVKSTIKKLADEGQITGQTFKDKNTNRPTTFYSPDEQAKIFEALEEFISLDYPPEDEGWKNQENIANQLADQFEGLGRNKVISTIKELKNEGVIKGRIFKDERGYLITFYSSDEQAKIFEALQESIFLDYPPKDEDWKNQKNIANQLADQFDSLGEDKVKRTIAKLTEAGTIKGQEFRDRNTNRPLTFYSSDEQAKIFEALEEFISLEYPPKGEDWKHQADIAKQLEGQAGKGKVKRIITKLTEAGRIKGRIFKGGNNSRPIIFYSSDEQAEIIEELENTTAGTSFPECAFAFYLQRAGIKIEQRIRPDWMKNPDTGYNLEVDIFIPFDNPPPLGIGIEYDGAFWHKNPDYDAKKNLLSRREGVEIIHIRESGCPELPSDIPSIFMQNNDYDKSLAEPIQQLFTTLGVPLPETGINIKKDAGEIYNLMYRNRTIQTFDDMTEETIDRAA